MQLELWGREPATRHNVFFGLGVPVLQTERIMQLMQAVVRYRRLMARPRPAELLHVSLVGVGDFAGPLPISVIEAAKAGAGTLRIAPFDVTFSSVASYGGNAIALQACTGDGALVTFREALRLALWKAGVRLPEKGGHNGFNPHVTMAYGERVPELSVDPISWTVDEVVLIDSLVGQSKHVALGRWSLSA